MAQRLNKKLLLGLGSSLGFLGTGVVSGFGINAIVNQKNDANFVQNRISSLNEISFDQASDYNVADQSLFYNTTDLKSFHFGNVQKGQTLTPWGWLGVFEETGGVAKKIALTAWNGQILWINDDYRDQNGLDYNVYEIKYDWNTNLIFVLRTSSNNGLLDNNNSNLVSVQLDVIDALTGVKKLTIAPNDFRSNQQSAWNFMSGKFLNWSDKNHRDRSQNLYYLDISSKPGTNQVAVTWMPNFMQLVLRQKSPQSSGDNSQNYLPPFVDIFDGWDKVAKTFIFEKNGSNVDLFTRSFNLRSSQEVNKFIGNPNWFVNNSVDNYQLLNNFHLLANPFITITKNNAFQIHLLVANKDSSQIYHKFITFQKNGAIVNDTNWDGTEFVNGNGKFNFFNDRSWANAVDWNNGFINANLRINRNMFDDNSVVFAYPFAAGGSPRVPIFNVAQILIDPNNNGKINWNGGDRKRSTIFNLAKEIIDYWRQNNGNYNSNGSLNKIFPFPGPGRADLKHNYNRLISVSPFDNTFLYATKPNLTAPVFDQTDANANKWASFWIINRFSDTTPYRPFVIANDNSIANQRIDGAMTTINDLYQNGLTFDLRSFINSGNQKSINLYFNQMGTGRNDTYNRNDFRTSKIGLLNDVVQRTSNAGIQSKLWVGNIANPSRLANNENPLQLVTTGIDQTSFSSLIYSRANLEKWFARTWFNNNNSTNLLNANQVISAADSNTRIEAVNFGSALNTGNTNQSIDLVSAWLDKNNATPPNWNRRIAKRPEIKVSSTSVDFALPLEVSYPLVNINEIQNKPGWQINSNQNNLIFKQNQNIFNASYEILTTFGKQNNNLVLNNIGNATDSFNLSYETSANRAAAWFDKRKRPNDTGQFGTWNNNVPISNKTPLRLMAKIIKPTNSPGWFNKIDPQIFANPYPIDNLAPDETGFQEVLNQFVREKTQNLEITADSANAAVGLANLKIEVYLGLNPVFASDNSRNTIYTNGNNRIIVDALTGQRVIYNDRFNQSRTIYDQSELRYSNFGSGGLIANKVNSNLWKNGFITEARKKINVAADYSLLQDNLVRKNPGNSDPIFRFNYASNGRDIEIAPIDVEWFRSRIKTFNKMTNLYVGFQYKTETNNTWTDYVVKSNDTQITGGQRKFFYDDELNLNADNKIVIRNFPVNNATKLRLKLWRKEDAEANLDRNHFVKYVNFNSSQNVNDDNPSPLDKFISVSHNIALTNIIVDKNWFNQVQLTKTDTANSRFLQDISLRDLQTYEDNIFKLSSSITNNPSLRTKVRLMYRYRFGSDQGTVDAIELVAKLKSKLADFTTIDQAVWGLWNGQNGVKIQAIFSPATPDSDVQFVNSTGQQLTDSGLIGDIVSNIKTKIDVTSLFTQFQSHKISARKGAQPGELVSFDLPQKEGAVGSGQFNGKPFAEIERILRSVGITTQYKKFSVNNEKSSWLNAANLVNTYFPNDPKIILGFNSAANWNVQLIFNEQNFNSDSELELRLNLPQIVNRDDVAITTFANAKPIKGNTYKINIDGIAAAEQQFKTNLINFNNQNIGSATAFDKLNLSFKYRLGTSGNFETAANLKTFLASLSNTQINNSLYFKIEIQHANPQAPDFELAPDLQGELQVYNDDNEIIKKFIHGNAIEQQLNNAVASGDFGNLQINFPSELDKIVKQQSADGYSQALKVQFSLANLATSADSAANPNGDYKKQWVDVSANGIPSNILASEFPNPNDKKIYLQIVVRNTHQNKYIYGPDDPSENIVKLKGEINLNTISRKISVDPLWFSEIPLVPIARQQIFLTDLSIVIVKDFEDRIWNNAGIKNNDPDRAKLTIKYEFENSGDSLDAQGLLDEIDKYQNQYDQSHLGILALWNGTNGDSKGTKIKARFATVQANDPTIKFVDPTGTPTTNLKGNVNTERIATKVDLGKFIENLVQKETTVNLTNNKPGTITSFNPPAMGNDRPGQFLNNKNYDQIASRLSQLGVTIVFQQINGTNSIWTSKDNVNSYDVKTSLLPFSFENQSSTLHLQVGQNQAIEPGDTTYQAIFKLRLKAPKQISIIEPDLATFLQSEPFSGNTKNLKFKKQSVDEMVKLILTRNAQANPDFAFAPLEVVFKLANLQQYMSGEELVEFLAKKTDDVQGREIKFKFQIRSDQNDQWLIEPNGQEYILYAENDKNPLQIFVNDQGLFNSLKKTSLSGTNEQLIWNFADDIKIDPNLGNITWNNPTRAQGLKIQYTFNPNANASDRQSDKDVNQSWVDQQPTEFDPNLTSLFIRIQPTEAKYLYEKIADKTNEKITLPLDQIHSLIEVDGDWLNQILVPPNSTINVNQIGLNEFNAYENLVKKQMDQHLNAANKAKVAIVYDFGNELNLSKDQIVKKIQSYPVTDQDFGWLQLWNNFQGTKITAKFTKADPAGNYDLRYKDQNKTDHLLDTKTIKTVVDLKPLISWLELTRVQIKPGTKPDSITELIFSPISANNSPFNNKKWELSTNVLDKLGIKIEYQKVDGKPNNPWGGRDLIDGYDGQGKFNVHFVLEQNKGNNVVVQIKNGEELTDPQGGSKTSSTIGVNLKVAKRIVVKEQFVNEFINTENVIRGNTKHLNILEEAENKLIQQIKTDNQQSNPGAQPSFTSAPLVILYSIGQNPNNIPSQNWSSREEFIRSLAENNVDQISNQINFKFIVNTPNGQEADFVVDPTINQLNSHEAPGANIKIAYYINANKWENYADNNSVSGTNSTLKWNWNSELNVVNASGLTLATLTSGLKGLRIEFTTKNNAQYSDPDGQAGADIKTKWTTTIPANIEAETTGLFIRLKAQPGFIYEAEENRRATVHSVDLQIKFQILVDKDWITVPNLTSKDSYLKTLEAADLERFSQSVLNNIIQPDLQAKVELLFQFNEKGSWLNANELIDQIRQYSQSYGDSNNNYGVLQLFNGASGIKIKAKFNIKPLPANEQYELIGANNSTDEAALSAIMKTGSIKTLIDLKAWINRIKSIKLDFDAKPNQDNSISKIKPLGFPGALGGGPLAGLTFDQLETLLAQHNIIMEWRAILPNQKPDQNWGLRDQLSNYDPNNPKIQLRFKADNINKAANLVLSIEGDRDFVGSQNQPSNEITLTLKVAAQIKIDPQFVNAFTSNPNRVGGNTKNLNLDAQAETELIEKIKNQNETTSPGLDFATAPLIIEYKLGDSTNWLKLKPFLEQLKSLNVDQKTNKVWFRFNLENQDPDNPDFSVDSSSQVLSDHQNPDEQNLRIQYYINRANWEKSAANVSVSGTNDQLNWNYGNWNVIKNNNQSLIQLPSGLNGLQIQYTTQAQPNYNDQNVGTNIETQWVNVEPGIIAPTTKRLTIRLIASSGFVYQDQEEGTATIHDISLSNIKFSIPVDLNWIKNTELTPNQFVHQLTKNNFDEWTKQVLSNLDANLRNKIKLEFTFNQQQNLNTQQLYDAIQKYLKAYTQAPDFGLLQLWNQVLGLEIKATFSPLQPDSQYLPVNISNSSSQPADLTATINTTNIKTLVNLQPLITFLKNPQTKISFVPGTTENSIRSLNLPDFPGVLGTGPLAGLTFVQLETLLDNHGVVFEWRTVKANNTENDWKPKNEITSYDPGYGQIELRLNLKKSQPDAAQNLVFSIENNQDYQPIKKQPSQAIKFNLQVAKKINLNQDLINKFKSTTNVVVGNTKFLEINADAEKQLIREILEDNANAKPDVVPPYTDAKLVVLYSLGDLSKPDLQWDKREGFLQKLAATEQDQATNQINFKFDVENTDPKQPDFTVEPNIDVLSPHKLASATDLVIKYYINDGKWEDQAASVSVSGTNNNLQWNWNQLLPNIQEKANQVFVGKGLRLEFSAKENARYDNPEANNDPNANLMTEWISAKPNKIPVDATNLWIRLKPVQGFVYGPEEKNIASAKAISLDQLVTQLIVNKAWIEDATLAQKNIFVEQITTEHLNQFIQNVVNNYQLPAFQNKITLHFGFDGGKNNLEADELYEAIQNYLKSFNNPTKGLLKLFDSQSQMGIKLSAQFVSLDPKFQIVDQDLQPNENNLKAQIKTDHIKTNIDLRKYVQYLLNNSLRVEKGTSEGELKQIFLPDFNNITSPDNFNGSNWIAASGILNQLGVKLEAAAFLDPNFVPTESDWKNWNEIKRYSPEIGKIKFRFKIEQQSNIVLSIFDQYDVNFDKQENILVSKPFDVNLAVPLKIKVTQDQIANFIRQSKIQGNTKFLSIDKQPENDFIDLIITANSAINNNFEQARGRIKIKYSLSQNPNSNNDWKERQEFIDFLKNQTQDQITNQINFALFVENPDGTNQLFEIDPNINTLINHQINKNAQVLIYVHEQGLEALAAKMAIQGTNNSFTYVEIPGFSIGADSSINNIVGLKLQYSTKENITNMPYDSLNADNMDPSKGWTNKRVMAIDAQKRYLVVQVVATDGYIYGADYAKQNPNQDQSPHWDVHQVDVSRIVSEIKLSIQGLNEIFFAATLPNLGIVNVKKLENTAKDAANFEINGLKDKVKIEYQAEWQGKIFATWTNLENLQTKIEKLMQDFSQENLGLLKFSGAGTTAFATIKARFVSTDPQYVVVDRDSPANNATQVAANGLVVKTDQLITPVDLRKYVEVLENQFIILPPGATNDNIGGFNPPSAPANGNNQFSGRDFAQISKALNLIGIKVEFFAPNSKISKDQWVSIEKIVDLNDKNELFLRFRLDETGINSGQLEIWKASFAISTKTLNDGWTWLPIDPNDQTIATKAIKLKVDLPILLNTNKAILKNQLQNKIKGTTAKLTEETIKEVEKAVSQLIEKTLTDNTTAGTDVSGAALKIQFSLDLQPLANNQIWFEFTDFAQALEQNQTNWNTNEIQARWFIDESIIDSQGQRYQISDGDPIIVQEQNNQNNAPLKMFIHAQPAYANEANVKNALQVKGNNQDYTINGLDQWIKLVPEGLEIFFSNYAQPDLNSDNDWMSYSQNQTLPKPLNANGDLRLRFKVKPGYLYENAGADNQTYSDPVILDTSKLQIVLNLTTEWLKKINLTGNLKELKINESLARQTMIASGQLPTGQDELIQFEYSIKGQKWFDKNDFENHLLDLAGKKDDLHFILKREELQVRFKLNGGDGKYQMQIDGTLIDSDSEVPEGFNVALIDDQDNRNSAVTGYINMANLPLFNPDNFAINGSTTKPILIIKNRDQLESLLAVYASSNLFTIEFSTDFDSKANQWQWSNTQVIWRNGKLVSDQELINQGIEIKPEGYFALRFRAVNNKYDVYNADGDQQIHDSGYIIDASKNVTITIEIENPFTKVGKTLGIWTRENNNSAHYEQGRGGFKIVVADKNNFEITNPNNPQSVQDFLAQSQDLIPAEKNALEFVYHIFNEKPDKAEMQQVAGLINNYEDPTWSSFDKIIDKTSQGDWSKAIDLKVGQFVALALRVKEKTNPTDQTFVLRDNDYSLVLPIVEQGGKTTMPGRIAGYEVKANNIKINPNINLTNNQNGDLPPIDGFTTLRSLNLDPDSNDQYIGVELDLLLYNEFWLDQNQQILKLANGAKLIKRDEATSVIKDQFYTNLDGSFITDANNNQVPILRDKDGRPTAPIAQNQATLTKRLKTFAAGQFGLPDGLTTSETEKLSFFRNQKIDVQLKARVGLGTNQRPDFYLDEEKVVELEKWISPQIKFPVENASLITYEWDRENFLADKIQYESTDPTRPDVAAEGQAKIASLLKLIRKRPNQDPQEITGTSPTDVLAKLTQELEKDFNKQLRFEVTYIPIDGGEKVYQDANIYRFQNLKNGDRIIVNIVPVAPDLVYLEQSQPLVINIRNLAVPAPSEERMRFLRVEQNGKINGQGSFRVLINDPAQPEQDIEALLPGWKFLLRVWNPEQGVKIDWTADQNKVTNLSNGDKVEWKLVSNTGNQVRDPYYNTIALPPEILPDGSTKFNFAKVHYPNGQTSEEVVSLGIGQNPKEDQVYPIDSGFVISGLQDALEIFEINDTAFAKVMAQLEPHYVGLNGQGTINFKEDYLNKNYYVNSNGELYEKPLEQPTLKQQADADVVEISLADFLANTTFYTSDPNLINYQNGFKFLGNDTNLNNHLSNGDQVWAQFDLRVDNNEVNRGISTELNPVTGLKDVVTDPMTPLWYILMAIGGFITLGGLSLFMLWFKRNRKLKK